MTKKELVAKIQYTNVVADATRHEIAKHCQNAAKYKFQAVMIQPCWIPLAKNILKGTDVRIASAICYPMGGETLEMKLEMVDKVIQQGADEFDFQPNIGFLKSGMLEEFSGEVSSIVNAAGHIPVKMMSEFGFLNRKEKIQCVTIGDEAGVAYIKNSSGIGPGGSPATIEDIILIKKTIKRGAKIKASGKIRNYEQAAALIDAGADLLGTSAAVEIMQRLNVEDTAY